MNLWQRYIAYLKDNPESYWFKRKLFGWGWTPATWEGWTIVGLYLVIIIGLVTTLDEHSSDREVMFMLGLPFLILTTLLIGISYKTGEPPKWQWGFPAETHEEQENVKIHERSDGHSR